MIPDADRERRLRFLERALDHYADPERALALAERMEWFVTGRAAPMLSLPAPEKPATDFTHDGRSGNPLAAEPGSRDPEATTKPAKNITENITGDIPVAPVADEAAAIVESAREVQRASKGAVERAEEAVKPKAERKNAWTPELCERFRRLWEEGLTLATIAERLGRTRGAVKLQAHKMGLKRRFDSSGAALKPWTAEDDATVTRMTREGCKAAEIAARLGRTEKSVKIRRTRLGVTGSPGRPRKAEEAPDPVAEFIARHGVTRCPTAAVAPTEGARIPEADRRALQERQPVEYRGTIAAYFDGGRARANARRAGR